MNAVDLYTCTDLKKGRITYQRTKTKNRRADKAEISVRIEPELKALMKNIKTIPGKGSLISTSCIQAWIALRLQLTRV